MAFVAHHFISKRDDIMGEGRLLQKMKGIGGKGRE